MVTSGEVLFTETLVLANQAWMSIAHLTIGGVP
jgi:hypothetical protein